jgi:hypothetical protein
MVGFMSTMDDQKVEVVSREIQETIQKSKQFLKRTLTKGLLA